MKVKCQKFIINKLLLRFIRFRILSAKNFPNFNFQVNGTTKHYHLQQQKSEWGHFNFLLAKGLNMVKFAESKMWERAS